jgi:coenzyme F420-reducing hydrogenase delta subunit
MEATVISERCTSCGVCIGACDFGAINLPEMTEAGIKEEMVRLLSASEQVEERPRILLLICAHSAELKKIADIKNSSIKGMANAKMIVLPCIGMVQPSMIEKGFESGADGIFLCGCLTNDCHYREGNKWLHERVAGSRYPFLTKALDLKRIREFHVSAINTNKLIDELRLFEEYLRRPDKKVQAAESKANGKRILKRLIAFSAIPVFLIVFFSMKPIYPFYSKGDSLIKLAIKYSSRFKAECRELTEKETEGKLRHMRKTESPFSNMRMDCSGERLPISIEISLDNKNISTKTYYPSGMKNDGPTFVYDEIHAAPGMHKIDIRIKDSKEINPLDYRFEKEIEAKSGEAAVIDLSNKF